MPNLRCNLLSVSKITRDKDCSMIFSSSHCVFQDKSSGRTMDKAEEKGGLYQIVNLDYQKECRSFVQSSLVVVSDSDLMLWHQRLGHPSFKYLRVLYPSISINKIQDFYCKHCILAKKLRALIRNTPTNHLNHFI